MQTTSEVIEIESVKRPTSWLNIACVGVVQACMGAVVVTTTTTLNRVMVVELALPAMLPGFLVSLHYFIQMVRPRMGHGADQSNRATPWILGGMALLSIGGILAAFATTWMASHFILGVVSALLAFCMIGMGVSACGTTLLVLLSKGVGDQQRAGAATAVWCMMIFGFAVTSIISGKLLDPFSFDRLLAVSLGVSCITMVLSSLSMWGLERRMLGVNESQVQSVPNASSLESSAATPEAQRQSLVNQQKESKERFKEALALLWRDEQARLFTFFVFTSMLAYSAQDLVLEPFAGFIYHYTPGQTTQLSGTLHASVLAGMLMLALIGSRVVKGRLGLVSSWMVGGCLISALGMFGLCYAGWLGGFDQELSLKPILYVLGFGNGLFSIAAISTMMRLATLEKRELKVGTQHVKPGIRMGLWGAAQAIAFGLGGVVGTAASDLSKHWFTQPSWAYAIVFALEATAFLIAAWIAYRVKTLGAEDPLTPTRLVNEEGGSRQPVFFKRNLAKVDF
jgi:BCD family chlorophyll transporter-like MFS transporter